MQSDIAAEAGITPASPNEVTAKKAINLIDLRLWFPVNLFMTPSDYRSN